MHAAAPQFLERVQDHHAAPGTPADRAGAGQLPGRPFQGYAAALRDRGGGAGADGEEPGVGDIPLQRADDHRRLDLPGPQSGIRSGNPLAGAAAQSKERAMNATTDQPMVRFEGVTKRYGALTVLDDLNLEVKRGEKVAIIGPSGSGKTTVLRMLMTLERIDGGVIWVDGEPMTHMPKNGSMVPAEPKHLRRVRSKIGMVFQHFNLFPHMTALGNCIEAPMTVLGLSRREAEERAADLLRSEERRVGEGGRGRWWPVDCR